MLRPGQGIKAWQDIIESQEIVRNNSSLDQSEKLNLCLAHMKYKYQPIREESCGVRQALKATEDDLMSDLERF